MARKASWIWHPNGELTTEFEQVQELLRSAARAERFNPQGLASEVPRLERRLLELAERAADEAVRFVMRGLPGDDFDEIKRNHPPTAEQLDRWREQAKVNPFAGMPELNWRSAGPDLLAACLVEPEWSKTQIQDWWTEATEGERLAVWNKAWELQTGTADIPFSIAATATTDGGGEPSNSAVSEESP